MGLLLSTAGLEEPVLSQGGHRGPGALPGPKAGTPESQRKALQDLVLNNKEQTPGY